ncbi:MULTISPECIES: 2,3-bisphosphoglycerate-independent phosphoglycerate mutase [Clostridium]|uniref:2,3-bisphosphoglycerate-independent phosphoglycerate mutase n=1 Tax=Clostridium aquiflavi TaxID=3073603 RepID=A0ABU1EGR2_9CLOT|nr:2,3-bisphosphoglycerate-independent phosphoglycerate mutase [Clostridium sp. 5N-1]MDR5587348.1 2,3-bisphosphoglycerate-independent phosphoglycerate mutase [Clostridium sp. 5N-1]NFG61994.1 2,3-bisphosphoglycerate-independent phosphoglycerate mutase [Clostridium botulinum]NFQ08338.1 2,3-bisphosphoglycerate-independent phosphoglycerate mutase [Clostridium botulinum]
MRKRQGILIIADGLGDRPNKELNGLTPLEKANTPNLDRLVSEGMCGNVHPIAPGIRVGTDVGHLEIFGYDSSKVYPGRGPLEAVSAGIEINDGDIAFRGNFGTIDENDIVIDRRAGRIRKDTDLLAKSLNGMLLEDGTKVLVKELTDHRVAVVLRGEGLGKEIICTDPGTACEGEKLVIPTAIDKNDIKSEKTAKNLLEFTIKANKILKNHTVNLKRIEQGEKPANTILTRGVGQKKFMSKITEKFGIKAVCIAGDKTVYGIANLAGMEKYTEDDFTANFDTRIDKKAEKAIEYINKGYDWVVVHVKATDLAGHDNLPMKKVEVIEKIDKMVGYVLDNIDKTKCYVSFTADHSTPCEARDHTGDGVPTIIWGEDVRKDEVKLTGEKYFNNGCLNNITASDIFMLQMDFMGFTKKRGA